MKYKVGDTVLVQGKVTQLDIRDYSLCIKFDDEISVWFLEHEIFELPKAEKTYEEGLQDAWELAKKVFDMDYNETVEVFDCDTCDVMKMTPQEALAKQKEYEDAKEIKVGDVVKNEAGYEYVVIDIYKDRDSCRYNGVTSEGKWTGCYEPIKTGKHIDIEGLLEQIRGE